jgi:hypothetical protein
MNWSRFSPKDFEYDFEGDELAAHRVTFEEAVEGFFSDFESEEIRAIVIDINFAVEPSAVEGSRLSSTQTRQCC